MESRTRCDCSMASISGVAWMEVVPRRLSSQPQAPSSSEAHPRASELELEVRVASFGESCRNRMWLSNRRSHFANGIGTRNEKEKRGEEQLERTYSKSYWADMTCPSAASSCYERTAAGSGGFLYIWSDQRSGGAATLPTRTVAVERAMLCQTDELLRRYSVQQAQWYRKGRIRQSPRPL